MGNSYIQLIQQINQLSNRKLREISFLLCSPAIAHTDLNNQLHYPAFQFSGNDQFSLAPLLDLTSGQKEELDKVSPATALGRYAESLMAFAFKYHPFFELHAHNLQLIDGKITRGEIDFLFREKQAHRAIHLEFALKYYLQIARDGRIQYIGPKGRDSLEGKSKKLVEHQLKFSRKYKDLLPNPLEQFTYLSQLMLKGVLFQPLKRMDLNDHHPHYWIKLSDRLVLEQLEGSVFYLLKNKRDWIYPYDPIIKEENRKFSEIALRKYLNRQEVKDLPLMFLFEDNVNERYGRLMVVHDRWPEQIA